MNRYVTQTQALTGRRRYLCQWQTSPSVSVADKPLKAFLSLSPPPFSLLVLTHHHHPRFRPFFFFFFFFAFRACLAFDCFNGQSVGRLVTVDPLLNTQLEPFTTRQNAPKKQRDFSYTTIHILKRWWEGEGTGLAICPIKPARPCCIHPPLVRI